MRIIDDDDVGLKEKLFDSEMRPKALGVCGKLQLFCFPLLCWGGIIIFIVWSVGKLKLFCFPFLCWGGILIFIMDHPPGHTFDDMQGKWWLLSPVSSTGDPFRCRSICNGYGVWINKTKHSGLDLILFNRLRESWRTSPESWHLSRIYNTITVYHAQSHMENISWALALKPWIYYTSLIHTYRPA